MFCRFIALLFLICTAAGCAQKPASNTSKPADGASSDAVRLPQSLPRDDLGREVRLAQVPQRVVVIGPGATEAVFALGAGSRLVGRDSASDYPSGRFPAGVQGVKVVGDFTGPFLESTIAERPDFIIVQGETYGRARIEDWQKKCGVPVAALSATTVEDVARGIEKMGAWLGTVDKAKPVADTLRQTPAVSKPAAAEAFFEVGRKPLWTAGRETLIDDVMKRAVLSNVARSVASYQQYGLETLLARQPAVYIVTTGRANAALRPGQAQFAGASPTLFARERSRVLAELRREPALKQLQCVQRGRVLVVPADWVLRPGPRLANGINELKSQYSALDAQTVTHTGGSRRN
jgi:iron complex transport system substrate-binding protein